MLIKKITLTPVEIKYNRFAYLIPIPFVLFLMWIFYKFVLTEPQEPIEDSILIYVAYAIMIVGSFLVLHFAWRFIKAPVIFRMDNDGILYNPNGVSTGLINWTEISDVNEKNLKVVRGDAPVYQTVLAIKLKDPDAFRKKHNILLEKILQLGNKMYDADVIIESAVLKKNYDIVKAEMKKRIPLSFLE